LPSIGAIGEAVNIGLAGTAEVNIRGDANVDLIGQAGAVEAAAPAERTFIDAGGGALLTVRSRDAEARQAIAVAYAGPAWGSFFRGNLVCSEVGWK